MTPASQPTVGSGRSPVTTHVLDTSRGTPASGVEVVLEYRSLDGEFQNIGTGTTDTDGRIATLLPPDHILAPGIYQLTFMTATYFAKIGIAPAFYPRISIQFSVDDSEGAKVPLYYHIPLLLSPFGYTTYRGS